MSPREVRSYLRTKGEPKQQQKPKHKPPGNGRARTALLLLVAIAGVFAIGVWVGNRRGSENGRDSAPVIEQPIAVGWIAVKAVRVLRNPGVDDDAIDYLVLGDRVDIYERRDQEKVNWYRVRDAAGYVEGWVHGGFVSGDSTLERIKLPPEAKEPRTPSAIAGISAAYVGADSCRECHSKDRGEFHNGEYGKWLDHFHSWAYESLSRPATKAIARELGIDEPLTDVRCVKCHVTAYGVTADRLGPGYRHEQGVTCEACHGPAGEYLHAHTQAGIDSTRLAGMGFRVLRDLDQREAFCRSCHNALSPTYRPFVLKAFSEAIRHWDLKEEYERHFDPMPQPEPGRDLTPPIPIPKEKEEIAVDPSPGRETKPVDSRLEGVAKDFSLKQEGGKKTAVAFSHWLHATRYVPSVEVEPAGCEACHHKFEGRAITEACEKCHEIAPGNGSSRENIYHTNCKGCHFDVESGPTKCVECHPAN